MSQLFKVEFDFGSGFEDVSTLTRVKEFYRERHIYNSLSPTVDTCKFRMQYDQSILSKLLLATGDILARVRTVTTGPVYTDYFYGYVQMNYKLNSSTRVDWIEVTLVDNNYILDKSIAEDLTYNTNKLMDYTDTSNSIIHQILYNAGMIDAQISDTIAYESDGTTKVVIEYFTHREKEPDTDNTALSEVPYGGSYKEVVRNVLFQFGYTYYFNASGEFCIFNFRDTNIDPSTNVFDNDNMIGTLEFSKKNPRYESSHIAWNTREILSNQIIFNDGTGGGTAAYPDCYIEVPPETYFPSLTNPPASATHTPEAFYKVAFSGGRTEADIISVNNAALTLEYADYIYNGTEVIQWLNEEANPVTTYTYTYKKALISTTSKCKDYASALLIAGISNVTDTSYSETDMNGGCCLWHVAKWMGGWCGGWGTSVRTRVWTDIIDTTTATITYTAEYFDQTVDVNGIASYNKEDYVDNPGDTDWFEALPLSFKFKIYNNGSIAKRNTIVGPGLGDDIGTTKQSLYITKIQLKGDIVLKGESETYKDIRYGATEKNYKYKADYIFTEDEVEKLAWSITDYFRNSTYKFKVVSNTLYEPGDWVLLTDNNFQNVDDFPVENKRCLVVSRKDEEFQSKHTYFLEEYAPYVGV